MRLLSRRARIVNAIDNPISPRGDGNYSIVFAWHVLIAIDNPISPRGDGNHSRVHGTPLYRNR